MRTQHWPVWVTAGLAATVAFTTVVAQAPPQADKGKVNPGKAPKAITWPSPELPAGPVTFDSAIERGLKLTITKGLVQPWSMAFLPDGRILVTEIAGRLRVVKDGVLDPTPVAGVPAVRAGGLVGLLDIALHPKFAENQLVYLVYGKPQADDGKGKGPGQGVITLGRGRWNGSAIVDWKDLFSAIPNGNASRMI